MFWRMGNLNELADISLLFHKSIKIQDGCQNVALISYPFQKVRWILGIDKLFHPTLYDGCDYSSTPALKVYYINKRGPGI